MTKSFVFRTHRLLGVFEEGGYPILDMSTLSSTLPLAAHTSPQAEVFIC